MRVTPVALFLLLAVTSTWQIPVDEFDELKETKNWKLKSEQHLLESFDEDDPPATYRLPNNTLPVRYDIWLKTDVDKADFAFEGRVKIAIRAVEATSTVTLHYRDMSVNNVDLIDAAGAVINASLPREYVEPVAYEFLRITLPREMSSNEEFVLHIAYNATLKSSNAGFYRAYYNDSSTNSTVYYGVTQFESTDARHAFPCYDEPGIRAPIGLHIQHNGNYTAYANMPQIDTIPVPDSDYVISVFDDTPSMQTYLLAFLVAPFTFVSNNDTVFPQRILAKPQSVADGEADYANEISDPILKKFIEHLGVNFTLPKVDHAAITQFAAGAMENWGFITYRESALLLRTSYTESQIAFYRMYIAEVIAHELAHQWTGNLVSPAWWTHLWLNEGFATLYEYYIPHLLWPDDGYEEDFRASSLAQALRNDLPTSASSVPMSNYVETPAAISGRFNFISYAKSGSVLKMFQQTLSVETFTKGVRGYLNKMSYKAAVPEDLFSSLQEACDQDFPGSGLSVASIMGSWVYQAGYPLVSVRKSGSNLIISQQRYPTGSTVYSVPLSFATKGSPDFEKKTVGLWLLNGTATVPMSDLGLNATDWIVFNVQQTGYYRMSYDSSLWHAIASGLRDDHSKVHFINRRVLQEELNIGYSRLSTLLASDVLEVQSYLDAEDKYLVWNDAVNVLQSLNTTLFNTPAYPRFLAYIQSISRPHIDSIGLEATDGEAADTTQLRARVKTFNCYSLDADCLKHEHQKLLNYMQDGVNNPAPDFCSAFRNANATVYARYLEELAENATLANRNRLVASIGCSLDKDVLGLVITAVEDTANVLTSAERVTIVRSMLTTSTAGFEVAFAYLSRNLEGIASYTTQLTATVNTKVVADALYKLLDDAVAEEFLTAENVETVKSAVTANLAWQEKHYDGVVAWFEAADAATTTTPAGSGSIAVSVVVMVVAIVGGSLF